ncbi:MAG: Uma2 family endonuclease [Cyanobacteria bacterium]|jgi:Uma2 family endonuclease|nr:Uma2 family endonuclease [Cyanobacteria bacterium GSL.Bin1]
MSQLTLNLDSVIELSREQFYQICQDNPDLKLERTATGNLVIMSPTGGETGRKNASLIVQVGLWNEQTQLGEVFDSSTGFSLPNGADRSPDVAWLEKSRWEALSPQQKEKFIPLCPDFVIELLSPTDNLKHVQAKMQEYVANGCQLGWLINQKQKTVEVYRPRKETEILNAPASLSGENVLPNFTLNLRKVWSSFH